jgi:hypothetical protein
MLISVRRVETRISKIKSLQLPQWALLINSDYA